MSLPPSSGIFKIFRVSPSPWREVPWSTLLIIVKLKNIDSENFYFRNFFIKYRVYPKIKSSNNQRIKINKKICHSFDEKEEQILS